MRYIYFINHKFNPLIHFLHIFYIIRFVKNKKVVQLKNLKNM